MFVIETMTFKCFMSKNLCYEAQTYNCPGIEQEKVT